MLRAADWWWDRTWNPIGGCSPISPGCSLCYAPRWLTGHTWETERGGAPHRGVIDRIRGQPVFNGKLTAAPPGHDVWTWRPLRWPGAEHPALGPGQPSLIFVGDMSDLFHEQRPERDIDRTVGTIALSEHIGLLLTKRSARMAGYFATQSLRTRQRWQPKMWLGFSAERQREFDQRWADMRPLAESGWRIFVSVAPMIGPARLPPDFLSLRERGWVIVAGEQGPHRLCRDMKPSWARAIRDQCAEAGVAFFMKQMARKAPIPPDLLIREFPQLMKRG